MIKESAEVQNSLLYSILPLELKEAVNFIFSSQPVFHVTGNEFPKLCGNLNERVNLFYKEKFDNKIEIQEIGTVKLDKRSIKDSIYHGINENKANAFAAVPYVLQNGKILNVTKNNNKNETRYLFTAPIMLKNEEYFCEVIVKSNKDRQGFYIHEIELKNKLAEVFSTAQHGTSASSSKSIIADLINKLNPSVK